MNKICSVVVPVYNAEKTIERTLASFISNKDYIKEVILVDDGSTDQTFNHIDSFRNFFDIMVLRSMGTASPGAARGTGLLAASGDWITFVDSDDCLTPSSLRYVYNGIMENEDMVLLYTKSIFYESGNFNKDTIDYSDNSCGGNFFRREYLIQNQLFPHPKLRMSEDEYFNERVYKFITYCDPDGDDGKIGRFDYPVYEVHHDVSDGFSYATSHWCDYICKYHLLYKECITEGFLQYPDMHDMLVTEFCDNFIFCFLMCQGLMLDDDVDFSMDEYSCWFKRELTYLVTKLCARIGNLFERYHNDAVMASLVNSAIISTGVTEIAASMDFEGFVKRLLDSEVSVGQ